MHSPFVFSFITKVLNDKNEYPAYKKVEALRKQLLTDHTVLQVQDFGAGSTISKTNERSVASIARHAAKPKKFGQLLHRIVAYYQPQNILELGTSLGITSCYLSTAKPGSFFITMEGSAAIAKVARQNFEKLQLQNITLLPGNFDDTLAEAMEQLSSPDLVFIDGNHRKEPTIRYFEQLLKKTNNDTILIFDDIHWSKEMDEAWNYIKQHAAVRCTIDLFFIGIVLFRQEFKEKQDFIVKF